MNPLTPYILYFAIALFAAWPFSPSAADELINRRDQARGAFLTTPQGVFQHYCGHCHGDDGKGGGRLWTSDLSPNPSDLSATELDYKALVEFIEDGSTAAGRSNFCPPWGRTISSKNIQRLARYIQSLSEDVTPNEPAPAAPQHSANEPFPWLLAALLFAEVLAVAALLFRKLKQNA